MRQRHPSPHGFTLVELLVVVGIIAVLLAILMPVLARARESARATRCLSNLRQIGMGLSMYQGENEGFYPVHTNWGNCFGKKGTSTTYDDPTFTGMPGETGTSGERPLDKYLTNAGVFECPSDIGDTYWPAVYNCFEAYGTSYLIQWNSSVFAVQTVTGAPGGVTPLRAGVGWDHATKIILGDWNWHANRPLTAPRTIWHPTGNTTARRFNMLFGDGHAEFYAFPAAYDQPPVSTSYGSVPPDPSRGFW